MTAKSLVFLRDNANVEAIGHLYTSFSPREGRYITTVLINGEPHHELVARWDDHAPIEQYFSAMGYTVLAHQPPLRSAMRAARWNGMICVRHLEEAMPLDETEANLASGKLNLELREYFSSHLAGALPAYADLIRRWTADDTIRWDLLRQDLQKVLAEPEVDSDADNDEQFPPVRRTIKEARELTFSPAPRCPKCGVGIAASGRNEPFAINGSGEPMCRQHGETVDPEYPNVLREYWAWRAKRAHALRNLET
ncbi:MAG: hypothetical protein U0414_31845 [Polyangiaceae bacterium]